MSHEGHLREAIRLAATASAKGRQGPFGARVVLSGKVVGEGWNRVVDLADPTAHAEIMAIRDACRRLGTHDLSGAILYSSCEPCPMCLAAVHWARLSEVHFAASAEDAAAAGFHDLFILGELGKRWEERGIQGTQALREEGKRVLEEWSRNPHRTPY